MKMDTPKLLTVRQLASMLGISSDAVYMRIARDQIPGVIRIGRSVRIRADLVTAWIERLTAEGT